MATVNIGNLTFTHKGDYASGTTYAKNDVVYYSTNGNAYIAKQATTGNAPTSTAHCRPHQLLRVLPQELY